MSTQHSEIIDIEVACASDLVANDDLQKWVNTNDQWIVERTGIKQRFLCQEEENVFTLSCQAVESLLAKHSVKPDGIIAATVTAPYIFPNLSNQLAAHFDIPGFSFDLSAACSGFIYALSVAKSMLSANENWRHILVVAADSLSKTVDWKDRNTCVLFGDAATATLVSKVETPTACLCEVMNTCFDKELDLRLDNNAFSEQRHFIEMNGKKVFKLAVEQMSQNIEAILERKKMTLEDIAMIVPHQANQRILDAIAQRLQCPDEKLFTCIANFGNTSAASIPIALKTLSYQRTFPTGSNLVLSAFGAGFTSGAMHWQLSEHQSLFR